MTDKKRILFCGCIYGAGNIGDDAILEGLVSVFRAHLPDAELGAISLCPAHTKKTSQLDMVWPCEFSVDHDATRWASHLVLGGGTLISENPSIEYPIKHCCRFINLAIHYNKPVSMLGAGVSDIRSPRARNLLRRYYAKYLDVITVRSEFDKNQVVTRGGLPPSLLTIGADAAFAMNVPENIRWQPSGRIGISLVSEGNDSLGYPERISAALKEFQKRHPQYVYEGVCSEIRKEPHFDYHLVKKTLESLEGDWPIQDDYKSPQDFLIFLSRFNVVFTMRMHVLVFCALLGVPCVTMVREQKMENMLSSLGVTRFLTMNSSADEIMTMLFQAVEDPSLFLPDVGKLNELKERAKLNVTAWVDRYSILEGRYATARASSSAKIMAAYDVSRCKKGLMGICSRLKQFVRGWFLGTRKSG